MSGVEFAKAEGLPQRQEEKKRAKELAKKAKDKKEWKHIYTERDGKLLKVYAKPNGAYSIFIAKRPKNNGTPENEAKLTQYKAEIEKQRSKKLFYTDYGFDEKIAEMIAEAKKEA
jgi:hypothetical protein